MLAFLPGLLHNTAMSIGATTMLKFVYHCTFGAGISQCYNDYLYSPVSSKVWSGMCSILGYYDTDESGNTLLHDAASSCDVKELKRLVNKGCNDINAVNIYNNTPLHGASSSCSDPKAIKILVMGGADIEAINNIGSTPLHRSAHAEEAGNIQMLLAHGAKTCVTDNFGNTPADILYTSNNTEIHGLLKNPPLLTGDHITDIPKEITEDFTSLTVQEHMDNL